MTKRMTSKSTKKKTKPVKKKRSVKKPRDDNKRSVMRVSMVHTTDSAGAAGVNCPCHTLTVQVPSNDKHVMRKPRVVPIMWGHFYASNPNVITTTTQMISDIVTGPYMNGLAQYGVGRGMVLNPQMIDIPPPNPDPTNLDRNSIRDTLVNWINNASVGPVPVVNEQNLIYVIFLPTGSTITDAGAAGYHNFAKFNPNSSDDDLFWAVILTNSAPQTSATNFARSLAFIVSHELNEAFTDRDNKGFTTQEGCEIGDICESRDPTCANCCTTFNYIVAGRTWQVEPYWSNWDNNCINGNQPISIRKFLQELGNIDGSRGLRQLNSNIINTDFIASRMPV